MTQKEIKDFQPIVQAWVEGKTIEYNFDEGWRSVNIEHLLGDISKYRIKPEAKYRPFKTKEECWNEMHKHPDFGWVRVSDKSLKSYYPISNISDYNNFNNMFKKYEFTDGEPFGIKEE